MRMRKEEVRWEPIHILFLKSRMRIKMYRGVCHTPLYDYLADRHRSSFKQIIDQINYI